MEAKQCSVDGCKNKVVAKGMCRNHYQAERLKAIRSGRVAVHHRGAKAARVARSPAVAGVDEATISIPSRLRSTMLDIAKQEGVPVDRWATAVLRTALFKRLGLID